MRLVVLTADFLQSLLCPILLLHLLYKSMFNMKCIDHKIRKDKVATAVPNYMKSVEFLPCAYA